jgi:nicotinamide-nucleotide amidase
MTPPIHRPRASSRELEKVLVGLLSRRRLTLALAESCTGGFIANQITNVPGASKIFLGGVVAYSNGVKQKFLGVRNETLARHGAVSEAVAHEMAEGGGQGVCGVGEDAVKNCQNWFAAEPK